MDGRRENGYLWGEVGMKYWVTTFASQEGNNEHRNDHRYHHDHRGCGRVHQLQVRLDQVGFPYPSARNFQALRQRGAFSFALS